MLTFVSVCAFANTTNDKELIKDVINKAYVDGIHNSGSIADVRMGFHPDFEMFIYRNGVFSKLSIEDWISRIERGRERQSSEVEHRAVANYTSIDITGNVASIKFDLVRNGSTVFTDYMYLYKIEGEWKIVSKVFHSH